MNKFNLWDVVKDKDSNKIFIIRLMRVSSGLSGQIQYGTGVEASVLYTEDELELVSKVMENPCVEIALDTRGTMTSRKGFQLVKKLDFTKGVPLNPPDKICKHKWKGIQLSDRKTVYDCEHCGIKKEDV